MTLFNNKTIIFIILLVHGIGHFQGVFAGLDIPVSDSWHGRSGWLGRFLSLQEMLTTCTIAYALAGSFTIVTALSYYQVLLPHDLWRATAVGAVILSAFSMIFFWNGLAFIFNKLGAVAVNALLTAMVGQYFIFGTSTTFEG